jgi:hypothetical protein
VDPVCGDLLWKSLRAYLSGPWGCTVGRRVVNRNANQTLKMKLLLPDMSIVAAHTWGKVTEGNVSIMLSLLLASWLSCLLEGVCVYVVVVESQICRKCARSTEYIMMKCTCSLSGRCVHKR